MSAPSIAILLFRLWTDMVSQAIATVRSSAHTQRKTLMHNIICVYTGHDLKIKNILTRS
jgi:hypothetical protein